MSNNEIIIAQKPFILSDNKYERIIQLVQLRSDLTEGIKCIDETLSVLKNDLVGDDSDDKYKLAPVFSDRKSTTIDLDKLKENPELYKKCITISGSDAVRLIGEDKIKELCVKYAGLERTMSVGKVTLTQMKKVMTNEEYKEYTNESYKQIDVTVVNK